MKILTFQGGLGNQLYEYSYYLYLKDAMPDVAVYGFYPKMELSGHNGLEINKWFDAKLPKSSWVSDLIGHLLVFVNRVEEKLGCYTGLIDCERCSSKRAILMYNYYQDGRFVKPDRICFSEKARRGVLVRNSEYLSMIGGSESVCIHLRFGDYLSVEGRRLYGDICTMDYYRSAIDLMRRRYVNPVFFVFSDDPERVGSVMGGKDMCIVDCNRGGDSFYDMMLMAQCKAMILANSTFSCWAAYLNQDADVVVAPSRLTNRPPYNANALMETWIKINNYGEILS